MTFLRRLPELTLAHRSVYGAAAFDLSEFRSAHREGLTIALELASLGAEVRGASLHIEFLPKSRP